MGYKMYLLKIIIVGTFCTVKRKIVHFVLFKWREMCYDGNKGWVCLDYEKLQEEHTMTIGENIRRIRKAKNMTMVTLAEKIGCDAALIRKYEIGERNPKRDRLEAIANALGVNVEVLANSEFDGVTAMHWLFQLFNAYGGKIKLEKGENGEDEIYLALPKLELMKSWYEEYCRYASELPDVKRTYDTEEEYRETVDKYLATQRDFCDWMDCYPETEANKQRLEEQRARDDKSRERYLNVDLIEQMQDFIAGT
ncbi:MAG: helix-turn-helix transcriptional regulator [Lachnospiraceae bacterium]|nr:helix-turn-helix transcriptional regulator [Lachnospiraceae bacterium]